jgi:hypothetical protein
VVSFTALLSFVFLDLDAAEKFMTNASVHTKGRFVPHQTLGQLLSIGISLHSVPQLRLVKIDEDMPPYLPR